MCYVNAMDYLTLGERISGGGTALIDTDSALVGAPISAMWCMMWCMKRTNIYLAEGQAAALDRVAQAAGVSRAELIRELIDRAIGGHPGADLVADLAAIDGSFGILAGEDTFARVRDERMDYLERLADA